MGKKQTGFDQGNVGLLEQEQPQVIEPTANDPGSAPPDSPADGVAGEQARPQWKTVRAFTNSDIAPRYPGGQHVVEMSVIVNTAELPKPPGNVTADAIQSLLRESVADVQSRVGGRDPQPVELANAAIPRVREYLAQQKDALTDELRSIEREFGPIISQVASRFIQVERQIGQLSGYSDQSLAISLEKLAGLRPAVPPPPAPDQESPMSHGFSYTDAVYGAP